jgi:acetyltransferase-like isoleucine patch superfamily enzyme
VNRKIRLILAMMISLAPGFAVRRKLYGVLLGYSIHPSVRIGWRTIIAVSSFEAGPNVVIDRFNVFRGPIAVKMAERSRIGRRNRFTCPWHIADSRHSERGYSPELAMGIEALFMDKHEVDLYGRVQLGDRTWFGGSGSQIWTHGLSVTDRNVILGDDNYIGASTRWGPGTSLGDRNVVALGSVVLSKIEANEYLLAGAPARPIRSISDELAAGHYKRSFNDW